MPEQNFDIILIPILDNFRTLCAPLSIAFGEKLNKIKPKFVQNTG